MASAQSLRNQITKTQADINILRNYMETYSILTDNKQFARQDMADRNAQEVYKVLIDKNQKLRNLRKQLSNNY